MSPAKTVRSPLSRLSGPRAVYFGVVALLLVLGAGAMIASHLYFPPDDSLGPIVEGFGEALVVSAILASVVDPYLKRRLRDDAGWDVLFGYLNPKAPRKLRAALRDLAACRQYNTKIVWTAEFAWQDEAKTVLAVTLEVRATTISLDQRPYRPNDQPWVLASIAGCQTEYHRYALNCPGVIESLDARGEELRDFLTINDDNSIVLDDRRLTGNREIPPEIPFETIKQARMYRHGNGYIPLHHSKFGDKLEINLRGPALVDLDTIVAYPRQSKGPKEWRRPASPPSPDGADARQFGRVAPGQVTLLSWGPKKARPNRTTVKGPAIPATDANS